MAEPWRLEEAGAVSVSRTGDRVRLVLTGAIDRLVADDLTDAVRRALLMDRPVDIDTRGVTFMDSAGLAALARLAYSATTRPTVLAPSEMVRFLLEVTDVESMVDIVDTPAGAAPTEPVVPS